MTILLLNIPRLMRILFPKQIRRKFSKEECSNPDDTDDIPNKRCSSVSFYLITKKILIYQ